MNDVIIAAALHVPAVAIRIGGMSMATAILPPAVRRGRFGENRLQAFPATERRFAWPARAAAIVMACFT